MLGRGLYGQNEGNESRSSTEWMEDRLDENFLIEGEWLKAMTAAAERGELAKMASLRDRMKKEYVNGGVLPHLAQERADSVLRQAMGKLRV